MRRRSERSDSTGRRTLRDLAIMCFVAHAGPVSTKDVRVFMGMSPTMVQRRLRVLFDLGYLAVHVAGQEALNRYVVTAKGRELLLASEMAPPQGIHIPRGLSRVSPHHAGTVAVYAALARACARVQTVRLDQFLTEAEIRRMLPEARGSLVPDGVAVLVHSDSEMRVAFAVEFDLSTENPSWVAQRKIIPYGEFARSGAPLVGCECWKVLCVVPTERRRNRLASACHEVDSPPGQWHFALAEDVTPERVLRPVWWSIQAAIDGPPAKLVQGSPFAGVITGRLPGSDGLEPNFQINPDESENSNARKGASGSAP